MGPGRPARAHRRARPSQQSKPPRLYPCAAPFVNRQRHSHRLTREEPTVAEYLSPGVYVEEIDAGPKPIEAVSTSTAGAIGVTERGPSEGKPTLVSSFSEFMRIFGGYLPEP